MCAPVLNCQQTVSHGDKIVGKIIERDDCDQRRGERLNYDGLVSGSSGPGHEHSGSVYATIHPPQTEDLNFVSLLLPK